LTNKLFYAIFSTSLNVPLGGIFIKKMNKLINKNSHFIFTLGLVFNMTIAPTIPATLSAQDTLTINIEVPTSMLLSEGFNSITLSKKEVEEIRLNTRKVTMTAYSSTPDQTDDSPFIAASGKHVYDGMIAANFLPFGTQVIIPELFGDKVFTVDDRMNRRYQERVDVWFPDRQSALRFGIREAEIIILNEA